MIHHGSRRGNPLPRQFRLVGTLYPAAILDHLSVCGQGLLRLSASKHGTDGHGRYLVEAAQDGKEDVGRRQRNVPRCTTLA